MMVFVSGGGDEDAGQVVAGRLARETCRGIPPSKPYYSNRPRVACRLKLLTNLKSVFF